MIVFDSVTKTFPTRSGPRTVLDGISLTVERGERVGIIGRNGSGKSTLVRLISGAEGPTSGYIHRGMSVSWPLAFAGAFQKRISGMDNLRFICRVYDTPIESVIPFVEEFSELGIYLREPVNSYSSGMRARLGFAISMAMDFDCYLIDEVLAVGDARFHQKCKRELFEKRADRSMIIVSHQPKHMTAYCSKFLVLDRGRIQQFSSAASAYEYYKNLG